MGVLGGLAFGNGDHGPKTDRNRHGAAAPIPDETADPPTNEFLREIRILVRDAIETAGGKLEGLSTLSQTLKGRLGPGQLIPHR